MQCSVSVCYCVVQMIKVGAGRIPALCIGGVTYG